MARRKYADDARQTKAVVKAAKEALKPVQQKLESIQEEKQNLRAVHAHLSEAATAASKVIL